MSESTEIMVTNQNLYISPVVGIDEAKSKFETVREYTAKCLTPKIDFGTVPGVSKPSLLKPGAEKICSLFGLTPKFTCVDKTMNWLGEGNPDHEPFFYFEYRCDLYRGGEFVASCDASCNSWEKKYRYRKGGMVCPDCGNASLMKSKYDDGFYCNSKNGGCGHKFKANDPRIGKQSAGEQKNFDTAEQVNTFQKMAQKRAFVGATLIACNLSEYYTQDVEDMSGIAQEQEWVEGNFEPVQEKKAFDETEYLTNYTHPANVKSMPYDLAVDFKSDRSGKKYGEMTTKELYSHWMGLSKKLNDPALDQSARENISDKISAIATIMWKRHTDLISQTE